MFISHWNLFDKMLSEILNFRYSCFQNRRPDFISIFMEKLVSWEAVSSRLGKAKARASERAREDEKRQEEDDGMNDTEAVEMYLDSENEESEAE